MKSRSVWIGYDAREAEAFSVARESIRACSTPRLAARAVVLDELRSRGLYHRPTEIRDGRLWDAISEASMSTEFAISRFLVPTLAKRGLALFMDCDMLVRANLNILFDICERDSSKAVWCVKHNHQPTNTVKMDGQAQTRYARKNWSSVMVFNVDHPSNAQLTPAMVNALPGRDLHAFCWLRDEDIGELGPEWNFLVGHSAPSINPKIVHFTDGGPWIVGYENVPYADEWRSKLWEELRTA